MNHIKFLKSPYADAKLFELFEVIYVSFIKGCTLSKMICAREIRLFLRKSKDKSRYRQTKQILTALDGLMKTKLCKSTAIKLEVT